MSATVAVGDIVQCTVFCQAGDQVSVNVFNYRINALPTASPPTLQECAESFNNSIDEQFKDIMSVNATYLGVKAALPARTPQPQPAFFADHNAGEQAADLLPRAVCGLITWRTGLVGRSYRGRTYTPFPAESDSNNVGEPTADFQTRLGALATELKDFAQFEGALTVATCSLVIDSKKINEATAVESFIARNKWGTQHRRGDYGRVFVAPV